MTPLAHRLVSELALPLNRRTFSDQHGLLRNMSEVHCFEMNEVWDLVTDMGGQLHDACILDGKYTSPSFDERTSFLPAPNTWIEFAGDGRGVRVGWHIEDIDGLALVTIVLGTKGGWFGTLYQFVVPLSGHVDFGEIRIPTSKEFSRQQVISWIFQLYAALAFINTPRIVGRRQHMPHAGLERKLSRAMKPQGHFPLLAWTEILLNITPTHDMSEENSVEAHLTGKKALHFCRAHLRIRLGRLEQVRAHWRGDASLGIKQSRYRLTREGA